MTRTQQRAGSRPPQRRDPRRPHGTTPPRPPSGGPARTTSPGGGRPSATAPPTRPADNRPATATAVRPGAPAPARVPAAPPSDARAASVRAARVLAGAPAAGPRPGRGGDAGPGGHTAGGYGAGSAGAAAPAVPAALPRVPAQVPRRPPAAVPQPRPTDRFAELLLAVLSGQRPVHAMLRHTAGRAYDDLARLAEDGPLLAFGHRPVVRDIGYEVTFEGALEVFARIGAGDRLRAMAFRLERGRDLRWRCTAVELDGPRRRRSGHDGP
ncbi:Rv3235 family protein [Streptomyces sp. enrichment culture]|uniref:Rv3235 family protein n=1 Tax=Streptomyces sp. enrichment culture TaxID=1795815 RepID=UPI003F57DB5E